MIDGITDLSPPCYVEHHQLLSGQPDPYRSDDVNLQLYPLLYIHERQVLRWQAGHFYSQFYILILAGYELETMSVELSF